MSHNPVIIRAPVLYKPLNFVALAMRMNSNFSTSYKKLKNTHIGGYQNQAPFFLMGGLRGCSEICCVKPNQATYHINGLRKRLEMLKTRTLYLNPNENDTCLKFSCILLGKSVQTPF